MYFPLSEQSIARKGVFIGEHPLLYIKNEQNFCSFCHENANSAHVSKRFQLMACFNIMEPREVLGCCPGNVISSSRPDQRNNGLVAGLSA